MLAKHKVGSSTLLTRSIFFKASGYFRGFLTLGGKENESPLYPPCTLFAFSLILVSTQFLIVLKHVLSRVGVPPGGQGFQYRMAGGLFSSSVAA